MAKLAKLGLLWRGDGEARRNATPGNNRLSRVFEELAALVRPFPVIYQYSIHKGAKHGYALPDRDIYDKQAANRDWEIIFDMYRRQIPPA